MSVWLRCGHCSYVWLYKGSSEFYASCPRCRYRVNIAKSKVSSSSSSSGSTSTSSSNSNAARD